VRVSIVEQTRMLITGGAGFASSHLALSFKREKPESAVVAFDNLERRGSELALRRLAAGRRVSPPRHPQPPRIWPTSEISTCSSNAQPSPQFITEGRSIYGATKLCPELIISEYVALYGLRAVINRCGVLT
jgi:nucleoside-diphosphate-sugar epimerase